MNSQSTSSPEKATSVNKVFDKLGAIRSRRNDNEGDSDEETMDEDSNCSSNEISGFRLVRKDERYENHVETHLIQK